MTESSRRMTGRMPGCAARPEDEPTLLIRHVMNNTFRRGRDHSTGIFISKPRVITELMRKITH
ncbi:hypothetical protein [Burkholderia sp. BCC1977]|uniref:hypothetical protein n=1 Tax=Burkholderia sp. BCC1977 TaxID=2817440 RepID=UPI002ABE31CD|nr:hypothetical protein [Burkholderia sp. BCC1977]